MADRLAMEAVQVMEATKVVPATTEVEEEDVIITIIVVEATVAATAEAMREG